MVGVDYVYTYDNSGAFSDTTSLKLVTNCHSVGASIGIILNPAAFPGLSVAAFGPAPSGCSNIY